MNPLHWGNNERAIIRTVRLLAMGAAAAGVAWLIKELPNTDLPGTWDAIIVALIVPVLGGLDKFLRGTP